MRLKNDEREETYLRIVIVGEVPPSGDVGVGNLSRTVTVVIVVATDNIPPSLEGICRVHVLRNLIGHNKKMKVLLQYSFYNPLQHLRQKS